MIAIIADDFSGAAELAGIAAARGFKAEVQTQFDPTSEAEVIAVDTDTRLRTESEAVQIVGDVARQIVEAKPTWIYKKTDSVLRGHIRVEIETLLDATGQCDCLFIPANPSKHRIINEGCYFVNSVPLNETVFAHDPEHPRRTAMVRELLGKSERIRTPDAVTLADLPHSIDSTTLTAGAADFFTTVLERIQRSEAQPLRPSIPCDGNPVLLVCGSLAAWEMGRAAEMQQRGFTVQRIRQTIAPAIGQAGSKLMLAIGTAAHADMPALTGKLIETASVLAAGRSDLRIGLEGGATALAFVRRMGWTRFEVIPEGYTGVGTLRPPGGPLLCVKPGSYPWPEDCFL
jgi:uncharacterized protein YgbK (DUF1537 family)